LLVLDITDVYSFFVIFVSFVINNLLITKKCEGHEGVQKEKFMVIEKIDPIFIFSIAPTKLGRMTSQKKIITKTTFNQEDLGACLN